MTDEDNFSNIQRLNSTIMAKYEWTSSLIGMQKTGEQVHDRRSKTYRKANEFLQELLQKRTDESLFDDNGALDRYYKFLKYKSKFDNDDITLDEFYRRLRSLNQTNRKTQTLKLNQSTTSSSQTTSEIQTDTNELLQFFNNEKRSKPFIINSSSDMTDHSLSSTLLFGSSELPITSTTEGYRSSSSSTSLNSSIIKIIHKPIPRRADGKEIMINSTEKSLPNVLSSDFILKHCHFPRSLLSREQVNNNKTIKIQLPSPSVQQFDKNQVYNLLDNIDNNNNFTDILGQLTLISIQISPSNDHLSSLREDSDDQQRNFIIPNLFNSSIPLPDYYKISSYHVKNPKNVFLYTMTIGTVQLSPSCLIPYSILNGRRPLLKCSTETNFKKVRSKRKEHIAHVTAIESLIDDEYLKENDIILKINNQPVYHLGTAIIEDILEQCSKISKDCLLTIARLCKPHI